MVYVLVKMSSTNGASGGGSGSNKESFDDLFKMIQKLEEKVYWASLRRHGKALPERRDAGFLDFPDNPELPVLLHGRRMVSASALIV